MAFVNHIKKEIHAKIVYYGLEGVGKATSLRYVHDRIRPHLRGELKVVPATSDSSALFFDFIPFEQPVFGDYSLRFHLYTLQGRVDNPAAWKMMLKSIDGLVIVMDASTECVHADQQSLTQLRDMIGSYGVGLDDIPAVLQLNKIELSGRIAAEMAARGLELEGRRVCMSSALTGKGVLETLTALSHLVVGRISERGDLHQERSPDDATGITEAAQACVPTDNTAGNGDYGFTTPHEFQGRHSFPAVDSFSASAEMVAVAEEGVRIEGGKISIPLDILTADGVRQRFVVTVMVAPG
jgi:signal recognition particle receptor subunit beta